MSDAMISEAGISGAKAVRDLIDAAIAERKAEHGCRDHPWEDRAAWLAYVEALEARREAVDRLVKLWPAP